MILEDGKFESSFTSEVFSIETSAEGDCSYDGGL